MPDFFQEIEKGLKGHSKVAIFIINSYPETPASPVSLLEQLLIRRRFDKVQEGSLQYYLKVFDNR